MLKTAEAIPQHRKMKKGEIKEIVLPAVSNGSVVRYHTKSTRVKSFYEN